MLFLAWVFMVGCSIEGPTSSTDESTLASHVSIQPKLLSRSPPLAKTSQEGTGIDGSGDTLYGELEMGKKEGNLVVGDDFSGKTEIEVPKDVALAILPFSEG